MGCPGFAIIGQNLVFSFYTHDPDTGAITAASSAPNYWIRDEDDGAVLNGTMDNGLRTGSYRKKVAITTGNGFAHGKTYTVCIEATVDGDAGGVTYEFTAYTNVPSEMNSGNGARTVTVTVDDGSDPIESALVRFTKGTETYVQNTNASGNCTFNLDDGTWTVAISRAGYTYSGTTQVVDGNETVTYSMTAWPTITVPDGPTLCTVQFRVKLSDTAVAGAVCTAKLKGINQAADGTILSNEESSDTTDAQGVAELQLVQKGTIVKGNGIYEITVEIDEKPVASKDTTIPNQDTYLFEDLL